MKIVSVLMAVIFTCVLGFSTLPGEVYAKSNNDKVTTEKVVNKKSTAKNIDINSANKDTLMQVPGIGPKTADSILTYRKANGEFKSVNDLTNVKGIGDKSLAKMKPSLKKF